MVGTVMASGRQDDGELRAFRFSILNSRYDGMIKPLPG